MKLLGRRRFPIKLRDDKRRVAAVEEGQEEFRFELRSTEVDLRPLDGIEGLRLIEITNGDHLDYSYRTESGMVVSSEKNMEAPSRSRAQ